MKKYQIFGFSYICDRQGKNVLNGTKGKGFKEVDDEYNIVCFNGLAYFKSPCGYYKMTYPKMNELTLEDQDDIYMKFGYTPNPGEYAPICGSFGGVKKISKKEFDQLSKDYPIKKCDYKELDWLNGNLK